MPYSLNWDNTGAFQGAKTLGGNVNYTILFCLSARDKESQLANNTASSVRESDVIFARGYKERMFARTDTAVAWYWRRIVFSCKGISFGADSLEISPNGWTRAMVDYSGTAATTARNALESILFKGTAGNDWLTPSTAKVDTTRVTLHSDRTRILTSGNQNGRYFNLSQWIPLNKNIVYSNDENGEDETTDTHSTSGKPGMGDVYIYDFITCSSGSTNDHMIIEPEGTFYWHEK